MQMKKLKALLVVVISLFSMNAFAGEPRTIGELKAMLPEITRQNCQVDMFVKSIEKSKQQCLNTIMSRHSACLKKGFDGKNNSDAIGGRKALTQLIAGYQLCVFEM